MTFQKSPNLEPNQLGSSKLKKETVNSIWSPIGSKSPNLVTLKEALPEGHWIF